MSEEHKVGDSDAREKGLEAWREQMERQAAAHKKPAADQEGAPVDPGKVFTENLPKMPGEGGAIV